MKASLTRTGAILTLLGGLAGLVGLLFLPFGADPVIFFPVNGIRLLQDYAPEVSFFQRTAGDGPAISLVYTKLVSSYASLWILLILLALITLLALFLIIRRKHGLALPVLCLMLSLLAVPYLFLAFLTFIDTPDTWNLLSHMFTSHFPLIGPGWWVSLSGLLLVLSASLLIIIGRFFPRRSSSAGLHISYEAEGSSGLSSRPGRQNGG